MNWRMAVPILLALLTIDAVLGVAAYSSKSWNFSRTEVLTGWPAVREVCLVMFPIFVCILLGGIALIFAALRWARRG